MIGRNCIKNIVIVSILRADIRANDQEIVKMFKKTSLGKSI